MVVSNVGYELPKSISEIVLDLEAHNLGQRQTRLLLSEKESCGSSGRRSQPKFGKLDIGIEYDNHCGSGTILLADY